MPSPDEQFPAGRPAAESGLAHGRTRLVNFDGLKMLEGDGPGLLARNFPSLIDVESLEGTRLLLIDGRIYVGALLMGLLFLASLLPFGAAVVLFAEHGFSAWEDFLFLLIILLCLAYLSLYSRGFFKHCCYLASYRSCFVFFGDKLLWAERYFRHFESETFLYEELGKVSHGYINGGGDRGRGLYVNGRLLLSDTREAGLSQHLYWLIRMQTAGQEIAFEDVDDR